MAETIRDVMTHDPRALESSSSAVESARVMRDEHRRSHRAEGKAPKHRLRRLPVVEKDGKLIGIVAQADVAKHATSIQTGEVVEKISN